MTTNNKDQVYKNRKFIITFELESTNEGSLKILANLWKHIQDKNWAIKNLNGSAIIPNTKPLFRN